MFDAKALTEILAWPIGAAAVIGVTLYFLAARGGQKHWANRLGVLIVSLAYAVGHWIHFAKPDWSNWRNIDAWQWVLPGVLAAGLIGVADAIVRRVWVRWIMRAILLTGFAAVSLQSFMRNAWDANESAKWIGGIAVAGTIWWELVGLAGRGKQAGNWFAAEWLLIAVASGALFVLSGSQRLLEMTMMLGCGIGVCMVIQMCGGRAVARGLLSVAPFVLMVLWLNGYFYGDMAWWRIAVPAAAPVVDLGFHSLFRPNSRTWVGGILGMAVVALVAAGAVVPAVRMYEPDPYSGGGY